MENYIWLERSKLDQLICDKFQDKYAMYSILYCKPFKKANWHKTLRIDHIYSHTHVINAGQNIPDMPRHFPRHAHFLHTAGTRNTGSVSVFVLEIAPYFIGPALFASDMVAEEEGMWACSEFLAFLAICDGSGGRLKLTRAHFIHLMFELCYIKEKFERDNKLGVFENWITCSTCAQLYTAGTVAIMVMCPRVCLIWGEGLHTWGGGRCWCSIWCVA